MEREKCFETFAAVSSEKIEIRPILLLPLVALNHLDSIIITPDNGNCQG
jgi:hypothetical protein